MLEDKMVIAKKCLRMEEMQKLNAGLNVRM